MTQLESLTRQLQTGELAGKISAAETLASMAEDAQPAIVALVQHCGTDDEELRDWCTSALESVGPPTAEQIDELALLAGSANTNVAFWAATLLGRAGTMALPAAPALAERSNDPSTPEVQKRAAWALERIQAA